jgi:hypothetical protein
VDTFSQLWSASELTVPVTPSLVRTVAAAPRPRAIAGDAWVRRAGVDDALNGRSGASLPLARFVEHQRAVIGPAERPVALLGTDDRIVLSSEGPWTIYDHGLKLVGMGMRTGGVVTVDPDRGLLYAASPAGSLGAHGLADARIAYLMPLMLGVDWERHYVAWRGQRMIVMSRERPLDPHAHVPELRCMIEVRELGDPLRVGIDGVLESALGQGDLVLRTRVLLAASHEQTIVLATEDRLYALDLDLQIRAAVQGSFSPVAMSLDETCRVHLVCDTPEGPAYWAVDMDGQRTVEARLAPELGDDPFSPVIAHDHHVFVLAPHGIVAFDPQGRIRWQRHDLGKVAGAIVTAEDRLLVAAGARLIAFETDGTGFVLHDFGGEELWTAPVLTLDGVIFVASRHHVYRLVASGRTS